MKIRALMLCCLFVISFFSLDAQSKSPGQNETQAAKQAQGTPDLSGAWSHQRSGGATKGVVRGTFDIKRTKELDADGFEVFSGPNKADTTGGTQDGALAMVGVKGDVIQVCIGGCSLPCTGSLSDGEIVARCNFLGNDAGEFRAKRVPK
jgi:hypothetical protein